MAVTYTTALSAWAYSDGTVATAPEPATPTFRTVVGVRGPGPASVTADDLAAYRTGVWVNSLLSQQGIVTFTTTVRVGQKRRGLIDGRADILSAGRYRR